MLPFTGRVSCSLVIGLFKTKAQSNTPEQYKHHILTDTWSFSFLLVRSKHLCVQCSSLWVRTQCSSCDHCCPKIFSTLSNIISWQQDAENHGLVYVINVEQKSERKHQKERAACYKQISNQMFSIKLQCLPAIMFLWIYSCIIPSYHAKVHT